MTSRERVLMSLNHETPDRVPVDCNAHRSSGIAVQTYKRLREHIGLPASNLYMYDVLQQLAIVEDDVLDYFKIDTVQFGYEFYKDESYWKNWKLHDGTEVMIPKHIDITISENGDYEIYDDEGSLLCVQKKDCLYFEQTCFPYIDNVDDEEIDFSELEKKLQKIMWCSIGTPPGPFQYTEESLEILREKAKNLRNSTDRAIYGGFGGNLLEMGEQAFRMDNFLMMLAFSPEIVHSFLDKLVSIHLKNLNLYLEYVGPYIDIIGFGDDLGMQDGPQMSPSMFVEFFKMRYKKMWDMVKEKMPHLKICIHSCGGIEPLIPHLIEAGLDAANPVQITCTGMEPELLKTKYGDHFVFWGGGCDTRYFLASGTPEEVDGNVKELVTIFKKNGGYVFQQVHNMLADVPPENIVAMYNAVDKYGKY